MLQKFGLEHKMVMLLRAKITKQLIKLSYLRTAKLKAK